MKILGYELEGLLATHRSWSCLAAQAHVPAEELLLP